jgi:hypothetical protein
MKKRIKELMDKLCVRYKLDYEFTNDFLLFSDLLDRLEDKDFPDKDKGKEDTDD